MLVSRLESAEPQKKEGVVEAFMARISQRRSPQPSDNYHCFCLCLTHSLTHTHARTRTHTHTHTKQGLKRLWNWGVLANGLSGILENLILKTKSVLVLLLLLLLLLFLIGFMQGIYNYIPEASHASRVYFCTCSLHKIYATVITIPVLNIMGFYTYITFRSMCAVPSMAFFVVLWFHAFH